MKHIFSAVLLLLLQSSFLYAGSSSVNVQLIQTDFAASQLSGYYDLRDRHSFIQVTNVSSSDATIHVQIFQHDRGCIELNFDDTLTANDTIVYDLENVIKNNGSPAPLSLNDDSYGYVVVSDRALNNTTPSPSLIGNFRIVDDAEYEYRANMAGASPGNPPITNLNDINLQAHFNTADQADLADLIGYVYVDSTRSSVSNYDPGISFDVFVYDMQEEPLSCDRRNFSCGRIMNYGVNEDYPNSKTSDVICPGGGLANPDGGYVQFENGSLGAPSSPLPVFVYLIGLNNGDGTGSMDTWIDPTEVPTLPDMDDDDDDFTDECPEDPEKEDPGQCGCGAPDTDSDNDGTADCIDNCPDDINKTDPGDCGCGTPDDDSDSDGTPDCDDNCPDDPNKTEEGICGCGTPDDDSDTDGTPDCNDNCPDDPNKTEEGICGCGVPDDMCETCNNLVNDDSDSDIDCADSECSGENYCGPEDCTDDFDNDGDGLVDCADPDCPEDTECGDGQVCDDTMQCVDEELENDDTLCSDQIDNDGDGDIDCLDSDCPMPSRDVAGLCSNNENGDNECCDGIDNDGDGLTDTDPPCNVSCGD